MFEVNDTVVYGKNGVCKVVDIGVPSIAVGNQKYYTLQPVYKKDTVIYAPLDNQKVVMREVMTKKEAKEFVAEIPSLDSVDAESERTRELFYKEMLKSCDCKKLVAMIKTLRERSLEREQKGKKATAIDERYHKMAEDQLFGELGYALEIEPEDVRQYIKEVTQKA